MLIAKFLLASLRLGLSCKSIGDNNKVCPRTCAGSEDLLHLSCCPFLLSHSKDLKKEKCPSFLIISVCQNTKALHRLAIYFGANLASFQKSKKILGDKQGGNMDFKKSIQVQKLFVLKMLDAPPACNSYFMCQFLGIDSVNYLHLCLSKEPLYPK